MGAKPKYDWPVLLERWVNFDGTAREFAEREGLPYYTLAQRMTRDKWHKAREAAQTTVEGTLQELAEKIESGKVDLTEFRRSQAWRNYLALVGMRDNAKLRPSDRARVAEKLADWDGVPKLEEDRAGDRNRSLTDEEVLQLKHTAEALLELRAAVGGLSTSPAAPVSTGSPPN